MVSNLKCNVNEMWTRPAAYIWKWDERQRWWWWRI